MVIESILSQPFRAGSWDTLIQEIFANNHLDLFATPNELGIEADNILSTRQLGSLELADGKVALLVIETSDQVRLARNRVSLRHFVSRFIDEAETHAVIAVFHQQGLPDWRITYASRHTAIDEESGEFSSRETAAKRYTFLVGANEPCRTAAERLKKSSSKGTG